MNDFLQHMAAGANFGGAALGFCLVAVVALPLLGFVMAVIGGLMGFAGRDENEEESGRESEGERDETEEGNR